MKATLAVVAAILCVSALAAGGQGAGETFYDENTKVIKLTTQNFKELVTNDKEAMWFVEFYAPWCGHCKRLKSTWIDLARDLESANIKVGAVDMTTDRDVGAPFAIRGFPTLKFFGGDKKKPLTF